MQRVTIFYSFFFLLGTNSVAFAADKPQELSDDTRLEMLKCLNQRRECAALIKQYNLDGIDRLFLYIGPPAVQNIILDYLHEGKREFILENAEPVVRNMYEQDKKNLADSVQRRSLEYCYQLACACSDYFYPHRLDLCRRLPILVPILWDNEKRKLNVAAPLMLHVGKIDHLSFINYQRFLKFNPHKPMNQQVSYKDDVDTLCVGYSGRKKGSLTATYWDLKTGGMIDYTLMEYSEHEHFFLDQDLIVTTSKDTTVLRARTLEQARVTVMIQDDLKDLNCAVLAKLLGQNHINS